MINLKEVTSTNDYIKEHIKNIDMAMFVNGLED